MKTACYFVCLHLFCWFGNIAQGNTISWVRQFGSNTVDEAHGVSADAWGNAYTTGYTGGDFFGSHAGHVDVFVAKHDTKGVLQWSRQFGTSSQDEGSGVAADGLGNVYVTGFTDGDLDGPNAGRSDGFLLKLNSDGVLKWKQQFGTGAAEISDAISVDELENIYVSGHTYGNLEGIRAGDADAFLSKYNHDGDRLWTRQVGTVLEDYSSSVHADQAGHIYMSGGTAGSLAGPNAGRTDAFISKYDLLGAHIWTRQFGSSSDDATQKVTTDKHGNVYIAGTTRGSIAGRNAGIRDPFVAKFDADGRLLWTRQFGTVYDEQAAFAASDGDGNVYVTGYTEGSLGGANVGWADVFIAKYDP